MWGKSVDDYPQVIELSDEEANEFTTNKSKTESKKIVPERYNLFSSSSSDSDIGNIQEKSTYKKEEKMESVLPKTFFNKKDTEKESPKEETSKSPSPRGNKDAKK